MHRRFQCNVCGMLTEVPIEYYCAVDGSGVRHDIQQRPELTQGSVEYIAPQEYMVSLSAPSLQWLDAERLMKVFLQRGNLPSSVAIGDC